MRKTIAAILLAVTLSGCAAHSKPNVVTTIEVPVPTKVMPPPELTGPITSTLPTFIDPRSPLASSALDQMNERTLRALINDLINRIIAWEAWAYDPATTPQPQPVN